MEKRVPKRTGTYADSLCAIGYATLLEELTGGEALVKDMGAEYVVQCVSEKAEEEWPHPTPGFIYIWRKSEEQRPPGEWVFDYEQEKELAEAAKKSRTSVTASRRLKDVQAEVSDIPTRTPHPDYRFAAIIEYMRKGWTSDKELYRWVRAHPNEALKAVCDAFQGLGAGLDLKWSNSQILNPSTGKGIHASKTIAKSASGFKLVEPFDEWMKLRALWTAMVTYPADEDFKFCVLEPGNISAFRTKKIRDELRDLGLWGGVRLDIEVTLRVLRLLLRNSEYERGGIVFGNRRPNEFIRGVRVSYFKKMGMASALMNDSHFPLPSWFAIHTKEDYSAYREIVDEPYGDGAGIRSGPLTGLNEKHSDEIALLQGYRRWLLTAELFDLLEFHADFAASSLQRKSTDNFSKEFDSRILTLLLTKGYGMADNGIVTRIVTSQGFLNIARAIRNTTIYAVGIKGSKREPQFGLAQRFKQRIKAGKAEFLQELSEFIQNQNWEVQHRLKGAGFLVSTSDIDEVVSLIEQAGPNGYQLVGMLLLAYGFAKAESTGAPEDQPQE